MITGSGRHVQDEVVSNDMSLNAERVSSEK